MRTILVVIGLTLTITCWGQKVFEDSTGVYDFGEASKWRNDSFDSIYIDTTVNAICAERGHVLCGPYMVTDMYCEPYLIDTEDESVMVYPACNYRTYRCQRCGKMIEEQEPERREVIWKRNK